MTTYLLDTNIVVFMVRGLKVKTNANAQQRDRQRIASQILSRARTRQVAGNRIALSAITVAELEFGARVSGNYPLELEAIRRAISPFLQLPFDAQECAAHYGALRHLLESAGRPIGSLDTLIVAHALAVGATLVTNNRAEFARVPGLKCEDWAA